MFTFTKKEGYGLLLLAYLAQKEDKGFISIKKISAEYSLPYRFVSKLALRLHKSGFLKVKEGKGGGYQLKYSPQKIKIIKVLEALEGRKWALAKCLSKDSFYICPIKDKCLIKFFWKNVQINILNTIKKLTLADLLKSTKN